jgi:maleate cis-trans isomerase
VLKGWRARVGFIYPASGRRDYEFLEMLPAGVSGHFSRVAFAGQGTLAAIGEMSDQGPLEDAARLLAPIGLDCVTWADTSGSFMFGVEGARHQAAGIGEAGGAPGSSTSVALLDACTTLGIRSLSVASPYMREVNDALLRFLGEAEIAVTDFGELGLPHERDCSFLAPERMRRLAAGIGRTGDALFIPCTDVPAVELIGELEQDLDKPVITANQVTAWHALRLSGVRPEHSSGGRLMAAGG